MKIKINNQQNANILQLFQDLLELYPSGSYFDLKLYAKSSTIIITRGFWYGISCKFKFDQLTGTFTLLNTVVGSNKNEGFCGKIYYYNMPQWTIKQVLEYIKNHNDGPPEIIDKIDYPRDQLWHNIDITYNENETYSRKYRTSNYEDK